MSRRKEFFWSHMFVAFLFWAIITALAIPLIQGIRRGVSEEDRCAAKVEVLMPPPSPRTCAQFVATQEWMPRKVQVLACRIYGEATGSKMSVVSSIVVLAIFLVFLAGLRATKEGSVRQ